MIPIEAVLFDLDGTLADTAPDLGRALNLLLAEHGRPPVEHARLRIHTSSGARGMIGVGFGLTPAAPEYEALKDRFLELYAANICVDTRLFDGMETLLATLERARTPWGIVTNKAARFTTPLVRALALDARAACVVSGDTTGRAKPHPDPLLHAAELIERAPAACLYVGDDLRDVQAARAAGMPVLAVRYGYLGDGAPPEAWGADAIIDTPEELLRHVRIG
jgi:phosphoglycolate phosphatase